jgi:hypothetical protein
MAAVTIQVRRDTAANWTSANPTLAAGEWGYETDTSLLKIGDGVTAWNSAPYSLVTATGTQTLTNKTITNLLLSAGTTTVPPLQFTAGTNLTTPAAGVVEYDGAVFYVTNDATVGRGYIQNAQNFKLTAAGAGITSTVAPGNNFFGSDSNIPLVNSGIFEIEIEAYFLKTTATTAIWTLTFDNAPTSYTVNYEMSPITGIVAPPGSATRLLGNSYNQTGATYTVTTGSLTTAVNHYAKFKIFLICGASTSNLKITIRNGSAGTITPGIGSFWKCTRLPATNASNYVA